MRVSEGPFKSDKLLAWVICFVLGIATEVFVFLALLPQEGDSAQP